MVAALSAVRPRVVLALGSAGDGLEARLFLGDLKPAWTGEAVLGPAPLPAAASSGFSTPKVSDAWTTPPGEKSSAASALRPRSWSFAESNRQLGDVDGIAAAQFDLANLDVGAQRFDEARARLAEAWQIFLQIGRADAIAAVGFLYGQLLASTDRAQALTILRTSRDASQRLGWTQQVDQINALLQSLEEPDES